MQNTSHSNYLCSIEALNHLIGDVKWTRCNKVFEWCQLTADGLAGWKSQQ